MTSKFEKGLLAKGARASHVWICVYNSMQPSLAPCHHYLFCFQRAIKTRHRGGFCLDVCENINLAVAVTIYLYPQVPKRQQNMEQVKEGLAHLCVK